MQIVKAYTTVFVGVQKKKIDAKSLSQGGVEATTPCRSLVGALRLQNSSWRDEKMPSAVERLRRRGKIAGRFRNRDQQPGEIAGRSRNREQQLLLAAARTVPPAEIAEPSRNRDQESLLAGRTPPEKQLSGWVENVRLYLPSCCGTD